MQVSTRATKQRWVVWCDPLTIASLKVLAVSSKQSVGYTLDQAVEYWGRKIHFDDHKPLKWYPPDDF